MGRLGPVVAGPPATKGRLRGTVAVACDRQGRTSQTAMDAATSRADEIRKPARAIHEIHNKAVALAKRVIHVHIIHEIHSEKPMENAYQKSHGWNNPSSAKILCIVPITGGVK